MQLHKLVVLAPVLLSVAACSREGKDRRLPDGVVGQEIVNGGASPSTQVVNEGTFATWTGSVSFGQATDGNPTLLAWDFNDDATNDQILCDEDGFSPAPSCQTSHCTLGPYAFSSVPGIGNPHGLLLVDFNGDGKRDVAAATGNSSNIAVAQNTSVAGTASFAPASFFTAVGTTAGNTAWGLAAGDLNADTRPDLAVLERGPLTTVYILGNTTVGSGMTPSFGARQPFALPDDVRDASPTLVDLDNDGKRDLIVPTLSGLSVFMNTTPNLASTFTFSGPTNFAGVCGLASTAAAANMNGDAKVDLVVTHDCGGFGGFSVFMNTSGAGSPSFTRSDFSPGGRDIVAVDMNASGFADVVVADTFANQVVAMINTTPPATLTATFAASVSFATTNGIRGLDAADLGGDAKPDLIGAFRRQAPGSTILQFINTTPTGSTVPSATITTQSVPPLSDGRGDVAIADLDGDGIRDIALTDAGGADIDILRSFGGQGWNCPVGASDYQDDSKGFGSGPTATHSSRFNLSKTLAPATFTQLRDVTVQNIAPLITDFNVIPVIAEGDFASAQALWFDPGVNDAFVMEVNWGDAFLSSVPRPIGFSAAEAIHRYANAGTYGVSATVRDDEPGGLSFPVFANITVLDTPPVIGSVVTNAPIPAGSAASVTVNLTNPDGDSFTYDFDWNGNGSFLDAGIDVVGSLSKTSSFTENFGVTRTVNVRANDDDGNTVSGSVQVVWTNRAPQAVADGGAGFTTSEDTAFSVLPATLLANDTDPDTGDTKTLISVAAGANGTVAISGPNVVFTPFANVNGTGTFTYTMRDTAGATSTATVTVTISAVNDPPVANADNLTTDEDQPVSTAATNLLVNDSDPDSALTVTAAGPPEVNGTANLNAGIVTFTPTANANGSGSFTYTVSDGTTSVTATVNVTIVPVNDPPVAVNDAPAAANEDTAQTISQASLLLNDTDADGAADPRIFVGVGSPNNGTAVVSGANVLYTPNANFNGTDTFSYTIRDAANAMSTGTVTVTITAVNDLPVAVDDTRATDEDIAVAISASSLLANDVPGEGPISLTAVSNAVGGSAALSAGVVTFTPSADFNGTGSFDYTLTEGADTDTGTVTVTVNSVNDPPVAVNDSPAAANEDTAQTITQASLLLNDTDADGAGDPRIFVGAGAANSGTVVVSGVNVVYTPNANFNGTDTFSYTIRDAANAMSTGTVTVTVTAVNDLPVAVDDTRATNEDIAVAISASSLIANDVPGEGPINLTAVSNAVAGSAVLSAGVVTFTPNANFNGTGSFDYTLTEGADIDTGTVTVIVSSVNDPPVAANDAPAAANEDTPQTITQASLLLNDTDVDTGDTKNVTAVGAPANGTAVISGTDVTYTPNANFAGTDTFTYTMRDAAGATSTATVTVTITAVNDVPAITAIGTQSATEGLLFQLQATTTGSVVTPLTWSLTVAPTGMTISATGTLTWVPTYFQCDDVGTPAAHTVTVQLLDGDGGAAVTTTFTVNATYLDADGDGMADTWEVGNGLDPTVNDATGDADGDGIRNLDEYRADNQGYIPPGQVSAVSPLDGQQSLLQDPVLDFTDATTGSNPLATRPYQLQIFDEGMVNLVLDTEPSSPSNLSVSTIVVDDTTVGNDAGNPSNVDLTDDDFYAWRVRVIDNGGGRGLWSVPVRFQYNPVNDAPTAPVHQAPVAGEVVGILRPELVVSNATDPDASSPLVYDFEVYPNATCTGAPVATSPNTPQGPNGTTKFVLATDLADDTVHCWRVFADDGSATTSSGNRTFTVNTANNEPLVPTISAPADGSDIATSTVTLIATNATDPDGDTLEYWFELDTTPTFVGPDYQVSQAVPEGATTTSFLTGALVEDATYWWRVRASDGYSLGDWALGTFFVSTADDAPTAPVALNPIDGATVNNVAPELSVQNAADPEGDAVTYEFEVRAGAVDGEIVASVTGVAEGTGGRTSWTVDPPLEKGVIYFWTASATSGALSTSIAAPESFFTYKVPKVASGCSVGGGAGPMAGSLVAFLALAGLLVRRQRA